MNIDPLAGPTGSLLKMALDAAQLRHQVHVTNIANANVSGYTPMRLNFADELARMREALASDPSGAGVSSELQVMAEPASDGQGHAIDHVEVDMEVAEIAKNTLHYQAVLKGLSRHLSIIGMAIGDGRR